MWHCKKAGLFVMPKRLTIDGNKMMKKTKISLWKWALGICMLFAGVQSAWALKCEAKIHIQPPAGVSQLWIYAEGLFTKLTLSSTGWYDVNSSTFGANSDNFVLSTTGSHNPADWFDREVTTGGSQNATFTCEDLTSGSLYIYENPTTPGKTVFTTDPPNAKYFFVMIPPDFEDWMSSVPMLSLDGGQTGKPMTAVPDMCGWYSYVFFNETITDDVVLYRDDDDLREDLLGANGNWETDLAHPKTIALSLFYDMGYDSVFFVPDEEQKKNEDGFYFSTADVEEYDGTCSYGLAAVIYDTDASLHPAFSCYGDKKKDDNTECQKGAQGVPQKQAVDAIEACIGVTKGLVESTLDPVSKKPKMTAKGADCFINEQFFNQLFNYTQGVNEKSCYEMPFERAADGKWEFDSDYYISPGTTVPGGFYPAEFAQDETGDAIILAADPNQVPVRAARIKHAAEGAVFYGPELRAIDPSEDMPVIDLLCNGDGWNGGVECDGYFADGDGTDQFFKDNVDGGVTCGFGWGCPEKAPSKWTFYEENSEKTTDEKKFPRWTSNVGATSGGRNQLFCFESHAKFTYKKGLKFNFRGDDDIWVFIDNRLAVDLGGTHLAAPGYVDLDYFFKDTDIQPGDEKDLDIFFCDRRTTMSNVRIKTNMYIRQKVAITYKESKDKTNKDASSFNLCYTKSGDGSCASAMSGNESDTTLCGAQLNGQDIRYFVVNGYKADANLVMRDPATGLDTMAAAGTYFGGGIDLSVLYEPKVDTKRFTPPPGKGGTFALFVSIGGKTKRLKKWRVTGEVDVVYADAKSYWLDSLDNQVADTKGDYKLKTSAMGGELVPVYISAVTPSATDSKKLDIIRPDAVGISYTLDFPKAMKVYAKNGAEITSGQSLSIDSTGVDTVYVTVPMELLQGADNYEISVKGRTKRSIKFYMPKIAFVDKPAADWDPVPGDTAKKDGSYDEHWVGSYVTLNMAVLKPAEGSTTDYVLCEDCELSITAGVDAYNRNEKIELSPDTIWFENGFATFSVRAQKAYRYDADPTVNNPAVIAVNGLINGRINDYIRAEYTPIYFREPPVPYPVLADVFDVEGAEPTVGYNMPSAFKSSSGLYLDGIGDSVVIYYDRRIHHDSLPTHMCILWDSLSAKSYLPAIEGWSNSAKDSVNPVLCNEVKNQSDFKCLGPDATNYCDPYVTLAGLKLSNDVKTSGIGHVYSYAKFVDKCVDRNGVQKCDTVKAGFDGEIVDRIAPVPVSAVVALWC